MKRNVLHNDMGIVVAVFFLVLLCGAGCDSTTSRVIEPARGAVYYTDPSGYANVPFTGIFKPHSAEAVVSLPSITVNLRDRYWIYHPLDLEIFTRYGTESEINDHGFELNGPDAEGQYVVTGTMRLPIDNYSISTGCWPVGGGSHFSDGSNQAAFRVESGMTPQDFLGGTHSFDIPPLGSTVGRCFCMSLFSPFGISLEYVIPTAMTPQGPTGDGVAIPGWQDLDQLGVVLLYEDTVNGFPEIKADFLAHTNPDEIVLDVYAHDHVYVVDVTLPDPDLWWELDMSLAGYDVYYICGFEYKFAGGVLKPVTAASADMNLTFEDIALKVAASRGGPCELARASGWLECVPGLWATPLDAMPECSVTALYDGRNID